MSRRQRPRVIVNCVADTHHTDNERTIEWSHTLSDGTTAGGLINFRELANGEFQIDLYRTEGSVVVTVGRLESPKGYHKPVAEDKPSHVRVSFEHEPIK